MFTIQESPHQGCLVSRAHTSRSRSYSENQDRGVVAHLHPWGPNGEEVVMYGVFDGHSGAGTSHALKTEFPAFMSRYLSRHASLEQADPIGAVLEFDRLLWERWRHGQTDDSGSTAVVVLVSPRELVFINLGDSTGLIFDPGSGDPFETFRGIRFHTLEHTPQDPLEAERIHLAGGSVIGGRIDRRLNLSRAFGDFSLKYPNESRYNPHGPVSAIPTVTRFPRSLFADQYVVLFSDGLSPHAVTLDQLSRLLAEKIHQAAACQHLADEYIDLSGDDMTILIARVT